MRAAYVLGKLIGKSCASNWLAPFVPAVLVTAKNEREASHDCSTSKIARQNFIPLHILIPQEFVTKKKIILNIGKDGECLTATRTNIEF